MHTKVGASPAYVLSQLSAAVAGAACFVASVFVGGSVLNSAKTAVFKPALVISSQELSRVGSFRLHLDHGRSFQQSVIVPDLGSLVPANVDAGLARIAKLENVANRERHRLFSHLNRRHRRIRVARAASVHRLRAGADVIRVSAAAPRPAPAASLDSEAQKLQRVHSLLLSRFWLSLRAPVPAPATTQLVRSVSTQDLKKVSPPLRHQPRPVLLVKRRKHVRKTLVARSRPLQPRKQALGRNSRVVRDSIVSTQAASESAFDRLVDQAAGEPDFAIPKKTAGIRPVQVTESDRENIPGAPTIVTTTTPTTLTESKTAAPPAAPPKEAPKVETVSLHGQQWVFPVVDYPKAPVAPIRPVAPPSEYPAAMPPKTVAMNTQDTHPSLPSKTAAQVNELFQSRDEGSSRGAPVALAPAPRVSFAEAFDWSHTVADAQPEVLTREDPDQPYGQSHLGWRIVRASEHWPSVYWNQNGEVPLLSRNAAKVLSLKVGVPLQNDAGIVMAKVPAGWTLEISGRAERPLIYVDDSGSAAIGDGSGQFLSSDNPSEERYYIYVNASPGAQLLYLVKNGQTGVIALPVFGGMLSYADLSRPSSRELSGKVLDASGVDARGMSSMQVQVIGSGQSTVTNPSGYFRINDVVTFGNQPVFLQVDSDRGYPHRYKIDPTQKRLALFYMSEQEIHDWLGQLDGGISSDSGLVVGALPSLASANESEKPMPVVKTLAEDSTLSPETYTLSSGGQLLVKTPLDSEKSRLLGVQVPEGPTLVELVDKQNRVIWSELIVVSARVLSVIGPR